MEFRETSTVFHKSLDKKIRSEQGIYFTPKKVRDRLFDVLASLQISPRLILEPSFGTGELLLDAVERYPVPCVGIERHPDLFASVTSSIETVCTDFLTWKDPRAFDLIVGNPPFVGCSQKSPALTGRSNTYILFLYKCLTEHLAPGGTLAFVLPTSLYNSSYYEPMRKYLYPYTIHLVETLEKPGFHDTTQETMLLVLQKTPGNGTYFFPYKQLYLSPYATELTELVQGATTMEALGLGVKTGNIVWNQHKDHLSSTGTLLLYSSNVNKGLVYPPLKLPKQQYIQSDKPTLDGPVILVTRGYGNTYHFQYALVLEKGFYAENHLNVIYPKSIEAGIHLQRVLSSFEDPRCLQYVKRFVGNGALSARELEQIPIY